MNYRSYRVVHTKITDVTNCAKKRRESMLYDAIRPIASVFYPAFKEAATKGSDAVLDVFGLNSNELLQTVPFVGGEESFFRAFALKAIVRTIVRKVASKQIEPGSKQVAYLLDLLANMADDYVRRYYPAGDYQTIWWEYASAIDAD